MQKIPSPVKNLSFQISFKIDCTVVLTSFKAFSLDITINLFELFSVLLLSIKIELESKESWSFEDFPVFDILVFFALAGMREEVDDDDDVETTAEWLFFSSRNLSNSFTPWIQDPPPDSIMFLISSSWGAFSPATPSVMKKEKVENTPDSELGSLSGNMKEGRNDHDWYKHHTNIDNKEYCAWSVVWCSTVNYGIL